MMRLLFIFLGCMLLISCTEKSPLEVILMNEEPKIRAVMDSINTHELQIIFTQIDSDTGGNVLFTDHFFGLDDNAYFYPASTVKFPLAVLTLEKLNKMADAGIEVNMHTPFRILSPDSNELIADSDSTALKGQLTMAHLIKKIFLVSDNMSYNYLFDFIGRDQINEALKSRGYNNPQILHKFMGNADNDRTWQFEFLKDSIAFYNQPSMMSEMSYDRSYMTGLIKGEGYAKGDEVIMQPFDFGSRNFWSLQDQHKLLKSIMFPESLLPEERFDLTKDDYEFLRHWMSRTVFESTHPDYSMHEEDYWDSYVKFIMFGDSKEKMPTHIRSYNKVGLAYGTLTESTLIRDEQTGLEFMVSMTLLVNGNQIFNDGIYEYESKGIPFMAEVGRALYKYEQDRKK